MSHSCWLYFSSSLLFFVLQRHLQLCASVKLFDTFSHDAISTQFKQMISQRNVTELIRSQNSTVGRASMWKEGAKIYSTELISTLNQVVCFDSISIAKHFACRCYAYLNGVQKVNFSFMISSELIVYPAATSLIFFFFVFCSNVQQFSQSRKIRFLPSINSTVKLKTHS